jgi:hypothetical protein
MTAVPLKYRSGEEIRKGDHVRFHGKTAELEFVAWDSSDPDSGLDWYIKEYGGGVMIREPITFGSAFIPADQLCECEDLEFVARG